MIDTEKIKEIQSLYRTAKKELQDIERKDFEEILNNVDSTTELFEQGYVNGIIDTCNILKIKYNEKE